MPCETVPKSAEGLKYSDGFSRAPSGYISRTGAACCATTKEVSLRPPAGAGGRSEDLAAGRQAPLRVLARRSAAIRRLRCWEDLADCQVVLVARRGGVGY